MMLKLLGDIDEMVATVKSIDRRLAYHEGLSRAQMNDLKHAVLETDPTGNVRDMNRTYLLWTGVPLAQIRDQGWRALVHPDDRAAAIKEWEDGVTHNRDSVIECRVRAPDGSYFPLRSYNTRIHNHGETLGWVCNMYRLDEQDPATGEPV